MIICRNFIVENLGSTVSVWNRQRQHLVQDTVLNSGSRNFGGLLHRGVVSHFRVSSSLRRAITLPSSPWLGRQPNNTIFLLFIWVTRFHIWFFGNTLVICFYSTGPSGSDVFWTRTSIKLEAGNLLWWT